MRLPFLRPKPEAEPARPAVARAERARKMAAEDLGLDVEAARTRARRRLVGAVVLLVIGVAGFPVLFETTPRPLPLDTPFEVPRREGAVPAPSPATMPARPLPVPSLPADAGTELAAAPAASGPAPIAAPTAAPAAPRPESAVVQVVPPTVRAAASAAVARPPASPPVAASPAPAQPVRAAATDAAEAARARALLDGGAAGAAGRFVVQVGAYTDATKLREARAKVEQLGMKSYTQVIENDAGKRTRVRVGPYATRAEADAAAAKVKKVGLPANVLTL